MKNLKFYLLLLVLFSIFCISPYVHAEELTDVVWHVPDPSKIYNYRDKYYSNSEINKKTEETDIDEFFSSMNNFTAARNTSLTSTDRIKRLFDYNSPVTLPYDESYFVYLDNFNFYFSDNHSKLAFDKKYQFLVKFNKSKSLEYDRTLQSKDLNVQVNILNWKDYEVYNANEFLEDVHAQWFVVPDDKDTTKNSNFAYLLVTFKFNSEDDPLNLEDFSLDNLVIKTNITNHDNDDKYFIKNGTKKDNLDFKVSYHAFMEDSSIAIPGVDGSSDGGHGTGGGRHDNLDVVYEDDVVIFDDYELCEKGDIFCLLNNLFTHMKNFFVRIGNGISLIINAILNIGNTIVSNILEGLKNFFVPKDGFLETNFQIIKLYFENKLGIVVYPLTLLSDILQRFSDFDYINSVITIPDISVGHFGTIVKGTSFSYMDILNSSPYNTIYNVYLAFVHCLIGFCLVKLCIKAKSEIIGGE